VNRGYEADRDLFRDLDASVRREAEISEQLNAWVQAHDGQHPPDRVVSDICEAAALRNSSNSGCVALFLCALVGLAQLMMEVIA